MTTASDVMHGRHKQIVRLFLASPNDVRERGIVGVVVESLNRTFDPELGIRIEVIKWETHVAPLMGRPEKVILESARVNEWDIFVGILWLRFGTPTGGVDTSVGQYYLSGTEEEFVAAHESWAQTGRPEVMFYRCTRPPDDIRMLDADQYTQVTRFFRQFEQGGERPGLVGTYSSAEEFERRLREDLTQIVRRLAAKMPSFTGFDLSSSHREQGFEKLFLPKDNEDRCTAKREAILQASEMKLVAYSGHAFLASIGHRYRSELITQLDRGATFAAVLTNPWSERGFLISLAERDPHTHTEAYKAYRRGDDASTDPVRVVEEAVWYSIKFRDSVIGVTRLVESYPGQIRIRLTDHEIPATTFLTDSQGFFEPYLHVDSEVRLKRSMLTFEMQISVNSHLYKHAENFFGFLWEISEPLAEFLSHEERHKERLAETCRGTKDRRSL
ncbi:MAG TPA: hypothetical protein VHT23_04515 [Gemmatimonadaceae bacterium]|jgi:hypothetical protein|nr:hypothetical protein [Gemmatimonadaceae bacterium]